jgi:hypothetical protein
MLARIQRPEDDLGGRHVQGGESLKLLVHLGVRQSAAELALAALGAHCLIDNLFKSVHALLMVLLAGSPARGPPSSEVSGPSSLAQNHLL